MSFVPNLDMLASYARNFQQAACIFGRVIPGGFNPATGQNDPDTFIESYSGSCLVMPAEGAGVVEFGEGPVTLRTYAIHLDGQAASVQIGDVGTVSGSRDDHLNEVDKLVVLDVQKSSTFTNRRIIVEEQL